MNTSSLIFKDLYMVKVPEIALMSDFEIEEYGILTTPGLSVKANAEIAVTTCMLSIARIATIYDKGFDISVCNHTDNLKMYDNISKHLHAWDTHLTTSVNKRIAPTKDLILLDEFANVMFSRIKNTINVADVDGFGKYQDYETVGMNAIKPKVIYDRNLTRKNMSDRFKSRVSINKVDMTSL